MKIVAELEIPEISVWYHIVGAFEGGSNYWLDYVEVSDEVHEKLKKAKFAGYVDENGERRKTDEWYPEVNNTDDLSELREKKLYVHTSQIPFLGGELILKEKEPYNHNPKTLNAETVLKGLELMAKETPRHFDDLYTETGDSTTSDVFLQLCVFGKVIYG